MSVLAAEQDGYICPVPVMPEADSVELRAKLEAFGANQGGRLRSPIDTRRDR